MANEFIWHDPVEAQQAMSYAANMAKADLLKQENLYRMAELGVRRQQAEQTNQLNRLLTENQLRQQNLDNQFRDKQLAQQLEIAKLPRYTSEIDRQNYDKTLREEEDRREASLAQQLETSLSDLDKKIAVASTLEKAPKKLEGQQVSMADLGRIAVNPIWGMSQLDFSGRRAVREYLQQQLQRDPSDAEINKFITDTKTYRSSPDTERLSALQQRKLQINAQLAQYGWLYDPATKKVIRPTKVAPLSTQSTPPPASSLNGVGGQTTLDDVKRAAAAAIQQGANPSAVYQRMADLGFDIR